MAKTLTSDIFIGGARRATLFVCPECGDLACDAITVLLSRSDRAVQWSDLVYDTGFETPTKLDHVGPFEFEWAAYLNEFRQANAD